MSNTLVLQSQWAAIETPYNLLILPSLQPAKSPVEPQTVPIVGQTGSGIQYIHDYLDCTGTPTFCVALFHLPKAPWWYGFFSSTCTDAGTDSGLPGYPAIDWARILANGPSDPFFLANPSFDVLPCESQTGGSDNLATGCFPPANADFWTLACLNDATTISWQLPTVSTGGGGGGGGGGKDPPGPLGFDLGNNPLSALNPTTHGAPRPVTVGCGCGSGESPELEFAVATTQPARAQARNIIVARRPIVVMKKGVAPTPSKLDRLGHGK